MTLDEIAQLVKANVDKVVAVKYKSGEVEMALVLNVDDEGFVYDLASLKPEDRKTEYWTPFSEIAEVQLEAQEKTPSSPLPVPGTFTNAASVVGS